MPGELASDLGICRHSAVQGDVCFTLEIAHIRPADAHVGQGAIADIPIPCAPQGRLTRSSACHLKVAWQTTNESKVQL